MLRLAREGNTLSVVDDQIGCPTYTKDLSLCLAELIASEKYGIYHVSNAGSCSWHEFAEAIFELAGIEVEVLPVSSAQFKRPAARPAYSVMVHHALEQGGFTRMRHWKDALQDFLKTINEERLE